MPWSLAPSERRKNGRTDGRAHGGSEKGEMKKQASNQGKREERMNPCKTWGCGPPPPSSHASLPKLLQDTYESFQDLAREPFVCEGEGSPRLQPPRFFISCATMQDLSRDPYKFFKTWSTRVLRCLLRVNLRLERRHIFCPKASSSVDFARIRAQNAALPTSAHKSKQ